MFIKYYKVSKTHSKNSQFKKTQVFLVLPPTIVTRIITKFTGIMLLIEMINKPTKTTFLRMFEH